VSRELKPYLKGVCWPWDFDPERKRKHCRLGMNAELYLEVHEPRKIQLPEECILGISHCST